jgi:molybdenum cofactor guanylyltransferase
MMQLQKTIGIVVAGGESKRMGQDKSIMTYHLLPQQYHVYQLLQHFCAKVFISCNETQVKHIDTAYPTIVDAPAYQQAGPMTALLSAFALYPQYDILLIGCDYPLLQPEDLQLLIDQRANYATAYFHPSTGFYEPLLALYQATAFPVLSANYHSGEHSLQHFLKTCNATKVSPIDPERIASIDTPEAAAQVRLK